MVALALCIGNREKNNALISKVYNIAITKTTLNIGYSNEISKSNNPSLNDTFKSMNLTVETIWFCGAANLIQQLNKMAKYIH